MLSPLLDFSTHPVAVISKCLGAEGSAGFSREAGEGVIRSLAHFSLPSRFLFHSWKNRVDGMAACLHGADKSTALLALSEHGGVPGWGVVKPSY